jgi:hypothetical protein
MLLLERITLRLYANRMPNTEKIKKAKIINFLSLDTNFLALRRLQLLQMPMKLDPMVLYARILSVLRYLNKRQASGFNTRL